MPRRRKKRQAALVTAVITLTWQTLVAIVSAITLAAVAYYRWASKIVSPQKRRIAYLSPIALLATVAIIGALSSPISEPERASVPHPKPTAPTETIEAAPTVEPQLSPESEGKAELEAEPEPYVEVGESEEAEANAAPNVEPEPYIEPEPVNTGIAYIAGTCPDLKAQGLGPFYQGEANYTSKRDRDNDGIACE